jgi:uncharacterized protein (DUF952 family)
MTRIYKLVTRTEWAAASEDGRFNGSATDLADGYIHFSAAHQAQETAERHFRGVEDLVLLAIEAESLGPALRWEVSRGGERFPHLYGPLEHRLVIETRPAPLGPDGTPMLGDLAP